MIFLNSIGTYLDKKTGLIYPAFSNDKPDLSNPISLLDDEVSSDWWDGLSLKDFRIVIKTLKLIR